jgi:hypothetical protein
VAALAALEARDPGPVVPALRTDKVACYADRDTRMTVIGVDPAVKARASPAGDFLHGDFLALSASTGTSERTVRTRGGWRTRLHLDAGWLYLAAVPDLFSRVRHGLEPVAAHASPSAGR